MHPSHNQNGSLDDHCFRMADNTPPTSPLTGLVLSLAEAGIVRATAMSVGFIVISPV